MLRPPLSTAGTFMSSHRIHLKGPWDYLLSTSSTNGPAEETKHGTARMPQSWADLFGNVSGTAEFRRKFHRPTNLESHERVMLVFTELRGIGRVLLNNLPIGQFDASGELVEFEITTALKPFNEIAVEMQFVPEREPNLPGGLFGPVALEIRSEEFTQ